jgi:hypothetical protein
MAWKGNHSSLRRGSIRADRPAHCRSMRRSAPAAPARRSCDRHGRRDAVHFRHVHVHQDKVVWLLLHGGNGLLAVGVGGIAASISFARDPPSTGTISGRFSISTDRRFKMQINSLSMLHGRQRSHRQTPHDHKPSCQTPKFQNASRLTLEDGAAIHDLLFSVNRAGLYSYSSQKVMQRRYGAACAAASGQPKRA